MQRTPRCGGEATHDPKARREHPLMSAAPGASAPRHTEGNAPVARDRRVIANTEDPRRMSYR
jgi:hypothetical protein